MRTLFLTGLLALTALAGCLDDTGAGEPRSSDADPVVLWDLGNATLPSGRGARDLIESYVMTHPFRVHGPGTQGFMDAARDDLEAELVSYGQTVVRQEYDGGTNILAVQEGTTRPDQWVVLSAHYDTAGAVTTVGPTVYGAWDDGAGTALLMEMARALAQWEFPFTVVYAFFDGEEKGLVGSRAFMDAYDPAEQDEVDLVANLNTDPPGLNWPCGQQPLGDFPVKVIHQTDKVESGEHPRYALLHHAVEYGLEQAGVPDVVRDYAPGLPVATAAGVGLTGASDHVSFGAGGVANVYLGGTPTTYVGGSPSDDAGAAALTYPLHTPLDTLEAMEARCVTGSLAGGLDTIAQVMTHALVYLAQNEVPGRGAVE